MAIRHGRSVVVAACSAVLLFTGCGTGSPAPISPPADCADLSADDPFTIVTIDFAFEPVCAEVSNTAAYVLRNDGHVLHTFTIEGAGIDIDIDRHVPVHAGEPLGISPGVYQVMCRLHAQMIGTLVVR